uniref:NADH dehydrogenase subunit 6 n=1 Tax=Ostrea edulis TaxID=37623 RepID=G8DUC9_OSTED|nr:NADH dehydrogenase subunit 6 [Ostrea edulis]ADZ62099.1 NADH dehydrogenase subunit 6 [Ostrea edulis]
MIVCVILSYAVLCSVYPVPLFFASALVSICMLAEIGANFSDFLAMLAFMVYISGIMGVIGYFITFFPKKFETPGEGFCHFSILYMTSLIIFGLMNLSSGYMGAPFSEMWNSEVPSTFMGEVVLFLAPILLIVMVAVVVMSKPELKTVRRWDWNKS